MRFSSGVGSLGPMLHGERNHPDWFNLEAAAIINQRLFFDRSPIYLHMLLQYIAV
jgi:hypothetical protein